MDTKLKKLTETEKRILLWMLLDLSMVLILCGKLLRKWASEFEWGMWRNIEWGIGIGVTAVGILGIAAALYLVWKFRKNIWNPKMTAFSGSEPEKAGKTAKSSEEAAADKSEADEIEKSRHMQFEARAAAEAEKEQLFLKKSEKVPNELLVLVGGFAFFEWLWPLRHSYARYRIVAEWGTVIECVQTGLLFFGICGVFLLSAGILVCRYEKKQLREMSFFCRERKRYRDRTSLERQLAGQSKWPFRVALIAELLIVITMITGLVNGMDGEVLFVILLGLTMLILILFAWKTYRSRLNREMGLLMEQIHTMAEGDMESRIDDISEKSLLYPAFEELENIESAMQKSVEKQMQAERLKIDLITNVSHDLKTPLTSMVGYTDLLKKEDLTPAAQDYVEVISAKQEQLKEMIQSLFELSKSTSGTEKFQMEKMDMKRLIEQTLADMDDAIAQSSLAFRTALGEEPLPFLGDNGKMYRVIQNLVENIESAMQKSVEKQMQAERLKIDLITNVSHDLKTPLTSMVGYTDLLKKEDLTPAAQDYVEVISAKQEQLKEMIQSLFELSKSTSGTEKFQMERMDMKRLLEQTLADMDDAIAQSGLSFRTALGEEPLPFLGDNGKMYRVVQNLVENILKYSLEGTRVYIDAGKENGEIFVTMKNISAYEMNFKAEEMMERFVRGDESRTSEGHGLGLAIASSYTANMGGRMELATDGDLFKVTLHFPEADGESESEGE